MTTLPPDPADDLRQENARLRAGLSAARGRQSGSAEILRAIAGTSGDAEQSLRQIAETTARLFNAQSVSLHIASADQWVRMIRVGASSQHVSSQVSPDQIRIGGRNLPGTVVRENRQIHVPDLDNIDPAMADWPGLPHARAAGTRTISGTPLRRDGNAIGVLVVYRDRLAPFLPEELALLQSFADQAVIAIENARLFNETQEALARQTATSDILRVISGSPTDVQPVFDEIVLTAARLLRCDRAFIQRCEGAAFWTVASAGSQGPLPIRQSKKAPIDPDANFPSRAIVAKKTLHLPDWSAIELPEFERRIRETHGVNSALYMPLLREGECIGLLSMTGQQAGMFGESEIALAESFRDQALIAIENARLFNATREALERQTATADILKVIASSPSDVQPVFEAIAASANRLIGGFSSTVFRFIDGIAHLKAFTPTNPAADEALQATFPRPVADFPPFKMAQAGEVTQIPDTETLSGEILYIARARGFRSMLFAPLMKDSVSIGFIAVTRVQPGAFAAHHVQLLRTFADQAVIAIENARLFNETKEALERQTATAEILKVIASSPTDVQPVFHAIAASANRLIGGFSATVMLFISDALQLVAFTPTNPTADEALRTSFPRPLAEFPPFELVRDGKTVQFPDTESEEVPPLNRELALLRGYRSMVFTPLMSKGAPIGILSVTREEPGAFAAHHVQLLLTFADQAVIAIENARLFNETKEALERQTATADILKVIASSPSDVQPVFEAIATSANRLLGGFSCTVVRFIDGTAHLKAFTPTTQEGDDILKSHFPQPVSGFVPFQAAQAGEVTQVPDTEAMIGRIQDIARARGFRSMVFAPLVNKGEPIGTIGVTRVQPGNFADHHVQLLKAFADQAVIAIENARLFDEVQARTRDLTESLQQQTATAEVLKVISRSVFDLQTVLDTLVESAYKLCGASLGLLYLRGDEAFECKAIAGAGVAEATPLFKGRPIRAGRGTAAERVILTGEMQSVTDFFTDPDFDPEVRETIQNAVGADSSIGRLRSTLAVPMTRDGAVVGVLVIARPQTGPFPSRQVDLLQTFADQAVIAIENARLFDEVQAKTRDLTESLQQQTATSEVLKVISSSPGELEPVFRSMLENAVSICDAKFGNLFLIEGDSAHWEAGVGTPPKLARYFTQSTSFRPTPGSHLDRVMRTKQVSHTADDTAEAVVGAAARLGGARSTVCVPMVKDDALVGTIFIYRTEVRPFTDKQIDLVKNFAAQAVIAIENTRLLNELRQRTDALTASLDDLRTAQDRLVQTEKLASLGQLTAGIAHEIKNPLNFVNNFSALSAELTDELNDVLKSANLTDKIRAEVDELTGLLKDNLQKVVQHGKRADSIVKNMLLHSREGSGDHRPADINALVDESLNLAYHGARAEKPGFNVTLRRDFDPDAGMIVAFPQEITRVFLNLISNGFYAVSKRKADGNGVDFEPVVSAATKGRGDRVEIRIRDNGTGIPPEVKEKMFNPFFTTKPAGEGTGLGLSMSHDIIVKQHGGTIDVDTRPGEFTEFRIVLPRTGNVSNKSRG